VLNSANFEIHSVSIKVVCERKLEIWGDLAWFSLEENAVTLLVSVTVHFPKLDVAGSIPVSRSFLSITWEYPYKSLPQFCRVNSQKPFPGSQLPEDDVPMAFACKC